MHEALNSREKCQELIRDLTAGDEFMSRYALLYAMECLDLDLLNRLVTACEMTVLELPKVDERAKSLMRERFGK